jgi:hypothetical protein
LDSVIVQIDIKFKDFSNFEFVVFINEKIFQSYSNNFHVVKFLKLLKQYPNYIYEYRLRIELQVVYSDTKKHKPPPKMLDFFLKVC